jgi:UDP:flavonoid glycosyltransferase YjiC (YdhE family)
MERIKILFFAEAVTLAHVGRPIALAQSLDPARFDVHFACADGYDFCFSGTHFTRWRIDSIPSRQFLQALAGGKPVYNTATLTRYVEDDLRVIDAVKPDLVVGDFRLSLSVSARLRRIPYISLMNAYWSPHIVQHYSVPHIPLTRLVPIRIANALFRMARPIAFASHSIPLNRVRRSFGLPSLGSDLRKVYTDADYSMYADVPELFPPKALPQQHAYIGPIIWAPPLPAPDWWDRLPADKPIVYVTLGSSGQGRLLPLVLEALADLPVTVIAATAGTIDVASAPANAFVAAYLPGDLAARRAALVICNGGSPTSQQALAAGVPVLGIAGNLDQFLNMGGVVKAGAGVILRADRFRKKKLLRQVRAMLADPALTVAAGRVAAAFANYPTAQRMASFLEGVLAFHRTVPMSHNALARDAHASANDKKTATVSTGH